MTIDEKIKLLLPVLDHSPPRKTKEVVERSPLGAKSTTCDVLRRLELMGLARGIETPTAVQRAAKSLVTGKVKVWALTRDGEKLLHIQRKMDSESKK